MSVSPSEPITSEVAADYDELDVDRLVLLPPADYRRNRTTLDQVEAFVREHAPARSPAQSSR